MGYYNQQIVKSRISNFPLRCHYQDDDDDDDLVPLLLLLSSSPSLSSRPSIVSAEVEPKVK